MVSYNSIGRGLSLLDLFQYILHIRGNKHYCIAVLSLATYFCGGMVLSRILYKNEGTEVQNTWQNSFCSDAEKSKEWNEFFQGNSESQGTDNVCSAGVENTEVDDWCEVDECPSGVTDTLLQQPDISENYYEIVAFAPAEGNKPLGLFMDKNSEFLSFPTIFCGGCRPGNKERRVAVSYSTVAKWGLRCQDRRAGQSVPNIFYKLKKLQIK